MNIYPIKPDALWWMMENILKMLYLVDFRHHSAQYDMHKTSSDWKLHIMKYIPVGIDSAKHLIGAQQNPPNGLRAQKRV